MKVGYLITGRLKSTRLPRKLLITVKGKPILSHMIERLKLAKSVDEIIICTSDNEQDKPLGMLAKENNVSCYSIDLYYRVIFMHQKPNLFCAFLYFDNN